MILVLVVVMLCCEEVMESASESAALSRTNK